MEADWEVSILELYYTAKSFFREYKKENVCGIAAIWLESLGSCHWLRKAWESADASE